MTKAFHTVTQGSPTSPARRPAGPPSMVMGPSVFPVCVDDRQKGVRRARRNASSTLPVEIARGISRNPVVFVRARGAAPAPGNAWPRNRPVLFLFMEPSYPRVDTYVRSTSDRARQNAELPDDPTRGDPYDLGSCTDWSEDEATVGGRAGGIAGHLIGGTGRRADAATGGAGKRTDCRA
jgi:hypothetical protein